jgi:phosphatidylinositol alpha-1,6-mannosyltransferase
MKTLFISEWFMPAIGGSISIYKNVYTRYPKQEITVLTKTTKGWKVHDKKSNIPTYRFRYIGLLFFKPESILIFACFFVFAIFLIFYKRIKIVHCDRVLRTGLVGYVIYKVFRIPYIVYAHGEEIKIREEKNEKAMRKIYNSAYYVIANSNNTKSILISLGVNKERITVIYPGVDLSKFNPYSDFSSLRDDYNLENKKVLLTIARLEKRKGHDFLLKSLPMILKKFPNTVYLIVGGGKEDDGKSDW